MQHHHFGLGLAGCAGALLMFFADLVLYYPHERRDRSSRHYFERIDPGGSALVSSSMASLSESRLMLGGALGPVAAVLYALGFAQLYFALRAPLASLGWIAEALPLLSCVGLSCMMIVGGTYHALFVYTGLLAKAAARERRGGSGGDGGAALQLLRRLVEQHQAYVRSMYKWAALPGLVGSLCVGWCCLRHDTMYPRWMGALAPALSAPIKRELRRRALAGRSAGGLALCGGLTNLWNLLFFLVATWSAAAAS